jgi:Ca2+-binding EF-hand superfamily protein
LEPEASTVGVAIGATETTLPHFRRLLELVDIRDPEVQASIFRAWGGGAVSRDSGGPDTASVAGRTLRFPEFFTTLAIATRGGREERLRFMFRAHDLNGDGLVSRAELRRMMAAAASARGMDVAAAALDQQVAQAFLALDENRDNFLSEEEFLRIGDSFGGARGFDDFQLSTELFEEFGMRMCTGR